MNPFLNIIIPLYNSENYIRNTLTSIINQTCYDFELIIINDGSTDNSLNITKEMLNNSGLTYQIYSYSNQGVSIARNTGLKKATANYIYFLDSDDIIEETMVEKIKKAIELSPHLLIFNYIDKGRDKIVGFNQGNCVYSGIDILKKYIIEEKNPHISSLVINNKFIQENKIYFTPNARYGEDHEFIFKMLYHAEEVYYINEILFNYEYHSTSAVNIYSKSRLDSLESAKRLYNYIIINKHANELFAYLNLFLLKKIEDNIGSFKQFNGYNIPTLKDALSNQISEISKYILKFYFYKQYSIKKNIIINLKVFRVKYLLKYIL